MPEYVCGTVVAIINYIFAILLYKCRKQSKWHGRYLELEQIDTSLTKIYLRAFKISSLHTRHISHQLST